MSLRRYIPYLMVVGVVAVGMYFYRQSVDHRTPNPGVKDRPEEAQNSPAQVSYRSSKSHGPLGDNWWSEDPNVMAKRLIDSGAPRSVVVSVLRGMLAARYSRERAALLYPNGVNRWSPEAPAAMDREKMAALGEIGKNLRNEISTALGADYYNEALLEEDYVRQIKWGDLTASEATRIAKVVEDYSAIKMKSNYGGPPSPSTVAQELLIDSEFARDVRSALPPNKAEEFLVFNSPGALLLQKRLSQAGASIDETSYLNLYYAEQKMRASYVAENNSGEVKRDTASAYLSGEVAIYKTILGDEPALALANSGHYTFGKIEPLLAASGLSASERLGAFFTYVQAFSAMDVTLVQARTGNRTQAVAEVAVMANDLYATLTARMTNDTKVKFDASDAGKILLQRRSQR